MALRTQPVPVKGLKGEPTVQNPAFEPLCKNILTTWETFFRSVLLLFSVKLAQVVYDGNTFELIRNQANQIKNRYW